MPDTYEFIAFRVLRTAGSFVENAKPTSFEPIVFNAVENAAYNAAQTMWDFAEGITHYIVLPYFVYKMGNWAFNGVPQPQPQPPTEQGFLSNLWDKAKRVATKVSKFVLPEIVSHGFNQLYLQAAFWDNFRPLTTAFMRPMFEKLLPILYDIWDTNDINFSLRELIPGGPGTWTSMLTAPFRVFRGAYNGIMGRTFAEKNALEAYELGKSLTNATEAAIVTVSDIVKSTEEIGPCILKGPDAWVDCVNRATSYLEGRTYYIREALQPVTTALDQFKEVAWVKANEYSGQFLDLGNNFLWGVATFTESKLGIPAHLVYYAEVGAVGYLSYKLAKVAGQLAHEGIRMAALGLHAAQQNNNVNIQGQPQLPLAVQNQDNISLGGNPGPQQQVLNYINLSQPQGAPVVPVQPPGAQNVPPVQGIPPVPQNPRQNVVAAGVGNL